MDYRFAIQCWQDQAGDENAKINVFINGTQVLTEAEVTAVSVDSPQLITWESTELAAPADDTTVEITVTLVNDYFVDADTDRNVWINRVMYTNKADGIAYKQAIPNSDNTAITGYRTLTDWNDIGSYFTSKISAVTGVTGWDDVVWNSDVFAYIPLTDSAPVVLTTPLTFNADLESTSHSY
jgi:hypothetical protein